MRRGYLDAIVLLIGEKPGDRAVIQTHARSVVASVTNQPLPPGVRLLADEPLPR